MAPNWFLLPLTFLLASCVPDLAPAAEPEKAEPVTEELVTDLPNVLLIVADDLGWADLNCYGSHLVMSPNLDGLARDGLQFMQAYAAGPLSSPTRASLQTGMYAARLGITNDLDDPYPSSLQSGAIKNVAKELPAKQLTLGELAKTKGYRTAHIGKWGLGKTGPANHGYDLSFAAIGGQGPSSYHPPYFANGDVSGLGNGVPADRYLTDLLTDKSIDLIQEWRAEPWLISLNYFAPSIPIQGRADWVERYRSLIDSTHARPFPLPEYAAMVSTVDENIGRLLAELRASDQLENTLIIFLSDNGGLHVPVDGEPDGSTPPTNNGILRGGKGELYEGGLRVPFILHFPKLGVGLNASLSPVITNDVFPTVAAAMGAASAYRVTDGQNLLPLLSGGELARRNLYWYFPHYSAEGGRPAAAVRSGDFKFYHDLVTDSSFYHNVVARPDEGLMLARPPAGQDLRKDLDQWLNAVRK